MLHSNRNSLTIMVLRYDTGASQHLIVYFRKYRKKIRAPVGLSIRGRPTEAIT